jgi:hypothetical protein
MASGTCAFFSVTAWWWPKASNRPATANQIYVHCAEEATQFLSYLQELPNTFFPLLSLFKARFSDAETVISKQCIQFWGFGKTCYCILAKG